MNFLAPGDTARAGYPNIAEISVWCADRDHDPRTFRLVAGSLVTVISTPCGESKYLVIDELTRTGWALAWDLTPAHS